MKARVCVLIFFVTTMLYSQIPVIESTVYPWKSMTFEKSGPIEMAKVLKGGGTDLAVVDMFTLILQKGEALESMDANSDYEEMIIVKEGKLDVTLNGSKKTLTAGGVVIILPGDKCSVKNVGVVKSVFYSMMYVSKAKPDTERGKHSGGSFMINSNDVAFKKHDRGGVRQYFERPTAMTKRFEMHVTTLNAGIKSHEPHTHAAEEIVLIIEGNVEMQIGDTVKKATAGDVIFLGSNIVHALKNVGKNSAKYFAFQWE